jgi:hypothetical protein
MTRVKEDVIPQELLEVGQTLSDGLVNLGAFLDLKGPFEYTTLSIVSVFLQRALNIYTKLMLGQGTVCQS